MNVGVLYFNRGSEKRIRGGGRGRSYSGEFEGCIGEFGGECGYVEDEHCVEVGEDIEAISGCECVDCGGWPSY